MDGAGGARAERRGRRRSGVVALAAVVVLVGAVPGALRGAALGRAQGDAPPTFSFDRARPCTVEGAADLEHRTHVVVDVAAVPADVERTVEVEVPTSWWEVDALRAPGVGSDDLAAARACLLGSPYGPLDVEFSSATEHTTLRFDDPVRLTSDAGGCISALSARLRYRVIEIRREPPCGSGLLGRPSTEVTARVTVVGADPMLHPPPRYDGDDWYAWSWDGVDPGPADLAVDVGLGWSAYAATVLASGEAADVAGDDHDGVAVYPAAVAGWAGSFLVASIVIAALAVAGEPRRKVTALAVVAVAALVGLTTVLRGDGVYEWSVFPLAGVGATAVVAARARSAAVATTVLLAVAVATAVVGAGDAAVVAAGDATGDALPGVAVAIAVLASVAVVVALDGLYHHAVAVLPRRDGGWRLARRGLACLGGWSAAYALGFAAAHTAERGRIADAVIDFSSGHLVLLVPFALTTLAAVGFRSALDRWRPGGPRLAVVFLATVSWAVVASPSAVTYVGVRIPIGVPLLAAAVAVVAHRRAGDPPLVGYVEPAAVGEPAAARALFAHGPRTGWRDNVVAAVEMGSVLAVVPVGYFVWGTVTSLPERTAFGTSAAYVAAGIVTEVARWLATGAVFGLLYTRLPGRNGPLKAASLAVAWFAVAVVVEVVSRWAGDDSGRVWTFPALQVFLFLVALGLAYDLATVRAAGGRWSTLQAAYGVERTRAYVAFGAPALAAVVAIAQQVATGTGLDFVRGVLESVPRITTLGS